jgi:cell wall-associated NlpC family hydrolase
LLLALGGCAGRTPQFAVPVESAASDTELRLRASLERWIGTPHCSRNHEETCTDCSRFVAAVCAEVFGLELPANTLDLADCGRPVAPGELRAGDLVFFQVSRKTRHVGIYLRNGEFAHASSSRGVMVSRLDERYWARRYWTARRVLPAS